MTDTPAFDDLIAMGYDPNQQEGDYDDWQWSDDARLAQTAVLLFRRGNDHAAALLLDVQKSSCESGWFAEGEPVLTLDVDTSLIDRFTDERVAEIRSAYNAICDGSMSGAAGVRVRETKPSVGRDWRQQLSADLMGSRPTNQARRTRLEPHHPHEDGLHFTNEFEWKVYRVLRQKQASLPPNDTIGIWPLPGGRVDENGTVEPDFLVTYQGRAGVIEVDGPHHTGPQRRVNDASRERRLRNAGVAFVERIDVRDTTSPAEVQSLVETFLRRLLERR